MTIPIVKNKSYSLLGGILFLVTTSIASNNFFGIPILGEPKDQLNKIIYYLIKNDPSKAKVYFEQLSWELKRNCQRMMLDHQLHDKLNIYFLLFLFQQVNCHQLVFQKKKKSQEL